MSQKIKKYFTKIKWIIGFLLLPIIPIHAEDDYQFYFSSAFNIGLSDVEDIKNTAPINGNIRTIKDDDVTGGFSGAVGYKWQQFRLEAEYLWRYRLDFGGHFEVDRTDSTNFGTNIQTQSIMLNAFWDFENQTKFTPYIGGGVGWTEHDAEITRGNLVTNTSTRLDTTNDNIVWALTIGTTYSLGNNWSAVISYSYVDLGDLELGPFTDGGKVDAEYISQDVALGLVYHF